MFGHQTQVTFVAPTRVKMSWTCRHAATKSAGLFMFEGVVPHAFQLPFISAFQRRNQGCPHAFACRAQVVYAAS